MTTPNDRATVLIVDDESLFRSSAAEGLRSARPHFTVLEAANGREALDHVSQAKIDVVVTDINMPQVDGVELLETLETEGFVGRLVVITAYGDSLLKTKMALQGVDGYLEKPIELSELIDSISSAVTGVRIGVADVDVGELVRLIELDRETCGLLVSRGDRKGELQFEDGVLVSARLGDARGVEVVEELLSWHQGCAVEILREPATRPHMVVERPKVRAEQIKTQPIEIPASLRSAPSRPASRGNDGRVHPQPTIGDEGVPDHPKDRKEYDMSNVKESLKDAMGIDGAIGIALVDHESGMSLGQQGGGNDLNLDVAGAGNTAVVRAKMRVMNDLGLDDQIEDILITLGTQFHLIRPLAKAPNLFLYLALARDKANLAMARHKLSAIEKGLVM